MEVGWGADSSINVNEASARYTFYPITGRGNLDGCEIDHYFVFLQMIGGIYSVYWCFLVGVYRVVVVDLLSVLDGRYSYNICGSHSPWYSF